MKAQKLSGAVLNNLFASVKIKIWIDADQMTEAQAKAYVKSGALLVTGGREHLTAFLNSKISPTKIFIHSSGFAYSELYDYLAKKVRMLVTEKWDEAELISLLIKGKNKIFIQSNNYSKEELLVFSGKGASLVLDHSIGPDAIHNFLSLPDKNIFIKTAGFEEEHLSSFLKKGASLILPYEFPEEKINALIKTAKGKIYMDTTHII